MECPPRNCVGNPVIVWAPQADGRRISAEIPPGSPTVQFFPNAKSPDDGAEAVWLTDTGLIAAYFGNDGRLQQKYFSTVHEISPPSFVDWLKTRRLFP